MAHSKLVDLTEITCFLKAALKQNLIVKKYGTTRQQTMYLLL